MATHLAVNTLHIAKSSSARAPRKTTKKTTTATVAQRDLFEKDLPPLTASVAQTFSGDVIFSMIGVAAILAAAALYIVRRSGIKV